MNYRLDKRYKKRNQIILTGIILVFVALVWQAGKLNFLSSFFTRLATPIWKSEIAFTDVFLKEVFTSKKDLIKQNEILKSRITENESKMAAIKVLEDENSHLKEIFLRTIGDRNIIATILSKPNQSPYGTIIIDIGSDDGVSIDDLVFANGNVAIGEIESVDKKTSRVVLFSAPGHISQVTLENTGRYFNARGRGAGDFEINFPRDLDIEEGQIFLYPSINTYIVGVVERVIFDPRDSYKTVLFRGAANIQELKWVQVRLSS